MNLFKEQSGFDPETMLGSYLFDAVGSSFDEPPQRKENYVRTSIQPTILFHELLRWTQFSECSFAELNKRETLTDFSAETSSWDIKIPNNSITLHFLTVCVNSSFWIILQHVCFLITRKLCKKRIPHVSILWKTQMFCKTTCFWTSQTLDSLFSSPVLVTRVLQRSSN